ncbi:MAG: hypothetical protein KDD82_24340 [Planctomycetes bacterium]|nr:hypothetical protein [Planctomycetota bacterium]
MRKFVVVSVCLFVCTPLAYGGLFSGLSKKKRRKHIARQKELNQDFQREVTAFFDVDAIPGYDAGLRQLEQLTDLRSQTGAFSSFRSSAARIPAHRLLEATRAVGGGSVFGQRRGRHTSTSLPFLDTRDVGDLTYKIEAVKIVEAALKELQRSPDNSLGGFQMMKFLRKLIGRVSSRQKGLVNSMLVLISVPYLATLSSTWWMGPTTAMDITWPGAKRGVGYMIEQVLKRYGRIGMGMNLQSYASQLVQGGGLAELAGGAGLSAGGALSQLDVRLGDAGRSTGELLGNVAGRLGKQAGAGLGVGARLGLGQVSLGKLGEVDLAKRLDREVAGAAGKLARKAGERAGDALEDAGVRAGPLNTQLGRANAVLGEVGLSLDDVGSSAEQLAPKVGGHLGAEAASKLAVGPARYGKPGELLDRQIRKQGAKLGRELGTRAVR